VRPMHVKQLAEDEWHANFKLPLGLAPGWHSVRVRVAGSRPGSERRIAVDVPLATGEVQIHGVSDSDTWEKGQLDLSRGEVFSFWATGLPENADRNNLRVNLDSRPLTVTYVEDPTDGARQVNVRVPRDLPAGRGTITVTLGSSHVADAAIEIVKHE
jgi:uncharacterized protein (TIGR03437 family)